MREVKKGVGAYRRATVWNGGCLPLEEENGKEVRYGMGGIKARELWGLLCWVERKQKS